MRPRPPPNPVCLSIRRTKRINWTCSSCRLASTATPNVDIRPPQSLPPSSSVIKPFYVTTPIFYVNAAPHVGHMYSMLLADIIKRYHALSGKKAILCTGTDEHGLKVQQAAEKAHTSTQPFVDKGAEVFKTLAARTNIANDHFVRTTDPEHKEAVQYAWQQLKEKGYIYTSKHEGWYSVSDETFYPKSAVHLVIDPPTGRKHMASMETGKEVEWTEESNYHFRLSAFQDRLLEFYDTNPDWIVPRERHEYMYNAIKEGLKDLSISRPVGRLTWGIPVPDDPSQTIYVWLDALMNYITKAGYPKSINPVAGGWPADVQVIGKDIMRFHCIYWPAFLMALDLPVPRRILSHPHWTLGNQKMAKSTGNVVNPFYALDRFGVDTMRFYLAYHGSYVNDADYGNEYVIYCYKHALVGQLGGLASRITRGKTWNLAEAIRAVQKTAWAKSGPSNEADKAQWLIIKHTEPAVRHAMEQYKIQLAVRRAIDTIYQTNTYLQEQGPWYMVASERLPETNPRLYTVLYLACESLRIVGIILQAFIPEKASLLLDMLGVDKAKRTLQYAEIGADFDYGTSFVPLGKGHTGALFPPLASDE